MNEVPEALISLQSLRLSLAVLTAGTEVTDDQPVAPVTEQSRKLCADRLCIGWDLGKSMEMGDWWLVFSPVRDMEFKIMCIPAARGRVVSAGWTR